MPITGSSIIAGHHVEGPIDLGRAVDPSTGTAFDPVFRGVDEAILDTAVQAAVAALDPYRALPLATRADFLDCAAANLEAAGEEIVERAHRETGLGTTRLQGELARTTGQLRLFANEVRAGHFLGVRVDHGSPDLRLRRIPIGPVAVFGASNFPLAFSTAGGDTASALAAGCPVVVKAHSAHAGTAELAGRAIADAVEELDLPRGVFSMVFGSGATVGQALAAHPGIRAIAFTGSQGAGTALMQTAAQREVPIPVFAEMSSINPAIVLPGAADDQTIAPGFVDSLVLGAGQFCTNPGLLFVPEGADGLVATIAAELAGREGQVMLTGGIRSSYEEGISRLAGSGVQHLAGGEAGDGPNAPAPELFGTDAATLAANPDLHDEVFGAAGIVVSYRDEDQLVAALRSLPGQLTASVHATDADTGLARRLLPVLEHLAGRLILNGWPTGVAVTHAMVHGGPYPATSDGRVTSVGTLAIERFLRPVSYQNLPAELLPEELRDDAEGIPQRIDGAFRA